MEPDGPDTTIIRASARAKASNAGSGVDVVIVAFGNADTLAETITGVGHHLTGCHVLLVDHAAEPTSIPAAHDAAASSGVDLVAVSDPANPGFAVGCNRMARRGTGRWLLFLNPDAHVVRWPWASVDAIPAGCVIGAELVGNDGEPLHHYGTTWTTRDEIRRGWLRRTPPRPDGRGFVSGAALLIERERFEQLGGFDERYFLFYEDIDLCLRACDAGARVVVEPGFVVMHQLGHSTRKDWTAALLTSLRSGERFHASRDGSMRAYDLFMTIDGALRAAVHGLLGRPARAKAHARVMAAAARSLAGARP